MAPPFQGASWIQGPKVEATEASFNCELYQVIVTNKWHDVNVIFTADGSKDHIFTEKIWHLLEGPDLDLPSVTYSIPPERKWRIGYLSDTL